MEKLMLIVPLFLLGSLGARAWVAPIQTNHYKFFDTATNNVWVAKGVAYSPQSNEGMYNEANTDLFSDDLEHVWSGTLDHLVDLGVNAIRLYTVDPDKPHDKFMCELSKLGIYVVIGLAHPGEGESIEPQSGDAPDCYSTTLKERAQKIVNAFAHYPNVLAFSVGNEINFWATEMFEVEPYEGATCAKKLISDMRKYIDSCGYRKVPVGVMDANFDPFEDAPWYACVDGDDEMSAAEWFGLNAYLLCTPATTEYDDPNDHGWKDSVQRYLNFNMNVPILLGEFGCRGWHGGTPFPPAKGDDGLVYDNQRTWQQVEWILTEPEMLEVYSGGFAFTFSNRPHFGNPPNVCPYTNNTDENFGIGHMMPCDCDHDSVVCEYQPKPEYHALAEKYHTYDPPALSLEDFTPDASRVDPPTCPSIFRSISEVTWTTDKMKDQKCQSPVLPTCKGLLDQEPLKEWDDVINP